ncbi:MAG: hypothetical protein WC505_05710 [Patescibacteria group bacterium]
MKIRTGFVSNSSSSSFVVIDMAHEPETSRLGQTYYVGEYGELEFGWQHDRHDGDSLINFAYMQAMYSPNHPEWMAMLDKVMRECTGATEIINRICIGYQDDTELGWLKRGYIDHQSSSEEGQNTEIFDDENTLKHFLFSPGSYIETDNDNH